MARKAVKKKVLIVDDSMLFREVIGRALEKDGRFDLVGRAKDAFEGKELIETTKPDIIVIDNNMPKKKGVELLTELEEEGNLIPSIVIGSTQDVDFENLTALAVDFVCKPVTGGKFDAFLSELLIKIKIASISNLQKILSPDVMAATQSFAEQVKKNSSNVVSTSKAAVDTFGTSKKFEGAIMGASKYDIIALGASTGGTEATFEVLKNLPANIPGMVIVQHMPPGFTRMYAERLDKNCALSVKEAETGDVVEPGKAFIAPGGFQMRVHNKGGKYVIACTREEKVSGHSPSVDVIFDSVADAAKERSIGIILTGMGGDGAKGMLKMRNQGAYTIGQDEATCVVYGMPKVSFDMGGVCEQMRIEHIAGGIVHKLATS